MFSWDDQIQFDVFLLCIPLKAGSIIISVIGIIYGFIGLFFFMSICIHFSLWKSLYAGRFDLLMHLFVIFLSLIGVFVVSIILMVAIFTDEDTLMFVFIWGVICHLLVVWLTNFGLFVYCFVVLTCFQSQGPGYALVNLIFNIYYSFIWWYTVLIINSYRMTLE